MSEDSYVFVCTNENSKEDGVELPAEGDGTLMLSVLQSQFDGALGLKYRNPVTGGWRAVKLVDGLLVPPDKGWNDMVYVVVVSSNKPMGGPQQVEEEGVVETEDGGAKEEDEVACDDEFSSMGYSTDSYKRKLEDSEGQRASKNPRSRSPDNYPKPPSPAMGQGHHRNQEDLIILGLEWTVTNEELKKHFSQFGEVAHCEVKKDMRTGKSRGFGFVRYGDRGIQASVFESSHTIKGRRVELKYPKQSTSYLPNKLFVGCLPLKPEVSNDEINEYFSQFGRLTDVYIPRPYRGFGFVTFIDPMVAQKVVTMPHTIRKSSLNVSFADPKGGAPKPSAFPPDPFVISPYIARHSLPPQGGVNRYSYAGQPQPAYALSFAPNQQIGAFSRPGVQEAQNPVVMAPMRTMPVVGGGGPVAPPTASPAQNVMVGAATNSGGVPGMTYNVDTRQQQQQQQQQAFGHSSWPIR